MILFGSLVQVKGLGFALVSSAKRWMAFLSSCRDWNTPRLSRFFARLAKKPSTALSHEADVGVKWKTKRGCLPIHSRTDADTGRFGHGPTPPLAGPRGR